MHVGDLDSFSTSLRNLWSATVTITVHDGAHDPVPGVTATGEWSNGYTAAVACVTGEGGQCTVTQNGIPKRVGAVSFSVVNASGSLAYEPAENHDPDGETDGTIISIGKP